MRLSARFFPKLILFLLLLFSGPVLIHGQDTTKADSGTTFRHDLGTSFRVFESYSSSISLGNLPLYPTYRIWYGRWGAQVHFAPVNMFFAGSYGYYNASSKMGLDLYFRVVDGGKVDLLAFSGNSFLYRSFPGKYRLGDGPEQKMLSEHLVGIGIDLVLVDRVHMLVHGGVESRGGFERIGMSGGGGFSYRF